MFRSVFRLRSPENDLEGDLHVLVVHLLDVHQVQLARHI